MLGTLAAETAHGSVASSPLTVAIVLPFLGALRRRPRARGRVELHRLVALLFSAGTGALTVWLLADFDRHESGFQFVVDRNWIADFGISWHLGIDGISLFLVVLSGLLFPLAIVAVSPTHDPKPYYAWLMVLQGGCIGVFCALDLFVFFVMFEIVLVPMYFLIGGWGYGERVYAALKFFIFTMLGSALMLVGIVSLAVLHRDGVEIRIERRSSSGPDRGGGPGPRSREVAAGAQGLDPNDPNRPSAPGARRAAAVEAINARGAGRHRRAARHRPHLRPADHRRGTGGPRHLHQREPARLGRGPLDLPRLRLAFAVKVPLFPLHTWLPDAHTQAPTAGSVILAGVMLKLGTYGFVRFGLYLFPEAAAWFAPAMVTLGVVGIIYGAVVATMQTRPEAPGRLLVGGPPRLHRARHVLDHHPGHRGRRHADGQPRHLDRCPLPPRRDDLRPPPHPGDLGAQGPAEGGPGPRRRVHARDAQLDRPPGPQRLRRGSS